MISLLRRHIYIIKKKHISTQKTTHIPYIEGIASAHTKGFRYFKLFNLRRNAYSHLKNVFNKKFKQN